MHMSRDVGAIGPPVLPAPSHMAFAMPSDFPGDPPCHKSLVSPKVSTREACYSAAESRKGTPPTAQQGLDFYSTCLECREKTVRKAKEPIISYVNSLCIQPLTLKMRTERKEKMGQP